ncbi:jhy protein homolog [Myxocyprinus asiaticus]|uniref:jhy protein homolog n=1 Tax=Myxocyprinus asiaticus TaxID=70543 RepID=UPI002221B7EB|nr:jhy protein homolog [Myxocyprinus asiaticus]
MLWDSLESETESLVLEKEYQLELQMRIAHDGDRLSPENFKQQQTDSEESEYSDEQIDVYDSLRGLKPRPVKGPQTTERHGTLRQTPSEDEYADLRYDPNWRRNLEGGQFLNQLDTRQSLDSIEESEDGLEPLENVPVRERQEYNIVSNSSPALMDTTLSPAPSTPFHLHPQQPTFGQKDILNPSDSKSDDREHLHVEVKQRSVPPQKRTSRHPSDLWPIKAREDIVERNKATLGINTHKQGSYLRAHQKKEDKPDETKQPRQTSYETVNTCSPESQDNVRNPELMWLQQTQKLKQSHKERKDPKKRERTNNQSVQFKSQVPEAKPKPGGHLKPVTERCVISTDNQPQLHSEDHMFPDAPVAYSYTHDPPQHFQSDHPSLSNTPTVNLNINLHSPANHAQPLNHTQQETVFTLVSQALQLDRRDLFNPPLLRPGYPFQLSVPSNAVRQVGLAPQAVVSSPVPHSEVVHRQYTVDRSVTKGLGQWRVGKPFPNAFENESSKNHNRLRIPVLRFPTSPQVEASHYPSHLMPTDEESVGPCAHPTQLSSAYTVLPPITRANVSDTEICSDRSERQLNPIHRSCSEGYLSQMERHRQMKDKSNYKVYTLKDYKNMKQEVKLGGLGPTNTIPEAMAEKIRRQKLYSNVIREQNKKISRIPSLLAEDPVGSDNKDNVPRRKALEYAKTIAKPKAPQKLKDTSREKNVSIQAQYLEEMDPTQMATLEMLRRHEEEKRAVAQIKTIHAI